MRRGRPPGSTNAAKVAAEDDFRRRQILGAYNDPGSSLGRTSYLRELLRNKAMANEALTNASKALLKAKTEPHFGTNHLGIECTVAALTRVSELSSTFPPELLTKVTASRERLDRARQEVKDAVAALASAEEEELEWVDTAIKAVSPEPDAPEPTVLWRIR